MQHCQSASRCLIVAGFGAVLAFGPAFSADSSGVAGAPTVVFVCDHGSAKSLVAASLFNRMAEQRGLAVRALSRALSERSVDSRVPDKVVQVMGQDGFQVAAFKPQAMTASEAAAAARVVIINVEGPVESASRAPAERWNDIAPVTSEYGKAKSRLVSRIEALLDDLGRQGSGAPAH